MNLHGPLVSIIVPLYNGAKYAEKTISSLLNQSYSNIEIIAINDGSTDDSELIIKSIRDERVIYSYHDNCGVATTLNKGLGMSSGTFVARNDIDDISHPQRIERQVAYMLENPQTALLGSWAKIINSKGEKIGSHHHPRDEEYLRLALIFGNPFVHSSLMYKRDVAIRLGGYSSDPNLSPPEDYDFIVRLSAEGQIHNLTEELVTYLQRNDGLSHTKSNKIKTNKCNIAANYIFALFPSELTRKDAKGIALLLHGTLKEADPTKITNALISTIQILRVVIKGKSAALKMYALSLLIKASVKFFTGADRIPKAVARLRSQM
jgi:glycosyltransferase involved in cell wall biosynthesis